MSREMKQSGIPWIGEIPISWEVMPHKRVMHKIKEIQEHYNGEDILSLTMRGVIVRDLDAGGKMPTSFDGYQKVYPNNLLQCLFDIDVTPRCVGLIKNEGLTSPAYSQFEMHSNAYAPYYDYLLRYMDDGKTLLHLSKNLRSSLTETDFGAIDTCVPSIIEQQKIASFLDRKCAEIDEMIALQEKIVEELKAYKQSVITETVTKGLNPDVPMKDSGIEWIGGIPEHWENNRLKNLFTLHRGYDLAHEEFVNEGVPVYGSGGFMGYHNEVKVFAPNIIIGRSGSTGKLHYVNEDFWAHNTGIYISDNKGNNIKYLFYVLSVIDMDFLSTKTAVPTLDRKKIQEYFFVYTENHKEQQEISDYLDKRCIEIDNLISIKLSKIDSLKEYKKSIIYEYVTGKKEVI